MANTSKAKGKRGENSVCDLLKEVFGLPFVRVFTSGAFFGGKNINKFSNFDKNQQNLNEGDIVVPQELEHLSIEVKNYKEFPFHLLYTDKCAQLDVWINQASHTNKPFWLLFFKITRKGLYICYPKKYELIRNQNHSIYKGEYVIELADSFLRTNKNDILDLKNKYIKESVSEL